MVFCSIHIIEQTQTVGWIDLCSGRTNRHDRQDRMATRGTYNAEMVKKREEICRDKSGQQQCWTKRVIVRDLIDCPTDPPFSSRDGRAVRRMGHREPNNSPVVPGIFPTTASVVVAPILSGSQTTCRGSPPALSTIWRKAFRAL